MMSRSLGNLVQSPVRLLSVALLSLLAPSVAQAAWSPELHAPGIETRVASTLSSGVLLWWRDADTIAVAGHRTTHGAPFRNLDRLRVGDPIALGPLHYRIFRILSVRPNDTRVLDFKGLVLSACDPPGSDSYRLVVQARKVPA